MVLPESERKFFSNSNVQEIETMDELFNYKPTKLKQKIHIKNVGIWYRTVEENDGKGGKRLCWVPHKPKV
jgi:hypothetical protein